MGKKQKKGKQEERYYYNEHDANQVNQLYRQRKQKRRKLRLKRVFFVAIIVALVAFVMSPYSRVGKITVEGNFYMNEEDIIEATGIKENSLHAFISAKKIEEKLTGHGVIKTAQCQRGFFNGVHIVVTEAEPLAYQENENNIALIGQNGEVYYIDKAKNTNMNLATRLLNFTEEAYLKEFAKEYAKIPEAIRSLVSDITYAPEEPYDTDRIQFDMNDGKKVYVRLKNMASEMKYYQEILSTKPDACIYDIHGKNVYATDCE